MPAGPLAAGPLAAGPPAGGSHGGDGLGVQRGDAAGDAIEAARQGVSIGRVALLVFTAVCLYLFFPTLAEVFEAWKHLGEVDARWLPAIALAELASFACVWMLQRIALRGGSWFAVVTTHLAGNAFNRVTPGGGATGAALQARMLADAGIPATTAGSAMAIQSILGTAALTVLPVCSFPLLAITGTQAPDKLVAAAWIGTAMFVVLAVLLAWLLWSQASLAAIGRFFDALNTRLRHRPHSGLADRLVAERDEIRKVLGSRWLEAVVTAIGRWLFEYLALLSVLIAIGASPDPALTLLAFTVSSLLTLIPLTPGGLGFVEVGLTGTLVAAGTGANAAIVATLAFRLVSFWLPLPIGLGAAWVFRRRYPRGNAVGAARVAAP